MSSQLLTNQWFGKAIGFTAAFLLAPRDQVLLSLAIIVGIGVGHLFDIWASREAANVSPRKPKKSKRQKPSLDAPHVEFLFTALGRIAKLAGVVSKNHIRLAETFITQLELDRRERQQAIAWFKRGKSTQHSLDQVAKKCRSTDARALRWSDLTTQYMAQMAALSPTDATLATTVQFAGLLNVAPGKVAAAFGEAFDRNKHQGRPQSTHHQQAGHQAPTPQPDTPDPLAQAFAQLGIPKGTSMPEVKTAYRRLVSKHHPDKLGPHASKSAISHAQQRMVELREALEMIEAKHG